MDITEFAFKLLLLFFPGIVCTYVVDHLTVHRPREIAFFLMQSFVHGVAIYFIYWCGLKVLAHNWPNSFTSGVTFLRALTDSSAPFSFREIAFVTALAVLIGCLISISSKYKLLNRFARLIKITKKFGELDVWGYMLNIKEIVWVTVRDHENNLIYDGWVQAFSDDSKDAELLLRDVSIYKNDTGEPLYQSGAVYLSRSREKISIECRALPIDEQALWKKEDDTHVQQGTTPAPDTATPADTATSANDHNGRN